MIKFPSSYIDQSRKNYERFVASISALPFSPTASITTGTTIISLVNSKGDAGIIASDGRVSAGMLTMEESFSKIFNCRLGFIGGAGALGLVQRLIPHFRADLENICDSRGVVMTASGGGRRLFQYYQALSAQAEGGNNLLAFVALFWDGEENKCHLYEMQGMSLLTPLRYATIGSGAVTSVESDLRDIKADGGLPETTEEMQRLAVSLITKASRWDAGTNKKIFFGIVQDGNFKEISEGGQA